PLAIWVMAPRPCSQPPTARRSLHPLVSITAVPLASPFRLLRFTLAPGIPPCLSRPAAVTISQSAGPEASGRSYSLRADNTRNTLHSAMIGEKFFLPFSEPHSPAGYGPSLVSITRSTPESYTKSARALPGAQAPPPPENAGGTCDWPAATPLLHQLSRHGPVWLP